MQALRWIVGSTLFLALLFLSLQNSELVTLKFYHWWSWQAPLIVIIFASFACGAVFGILALLATLLRQRREIARLKRAARLRDAPSFPPVAGL